MQPSSSTRRVEREPDRPAVAERPASLDGRTVGLLDISKPRATCSSAAWKSC